MKNVKKTIESNTEFLACASCACNSQSSFDSYQEYLKVTHKKLCVGEHSPEDGFNLTEDDRKNLIAYLEKKIKEREENYESLKKIKGYECDI